MINYIEKGIHLHKALHEAGYDIYHSDGVPTATRTDGAVMLQSDVNTVNQLIADFDPLPYAKAEAKEKIKEAAANARARYVTGGAGKDAEYTLKAAEAKQFTVDGTVGVFMQGRMNLTGETAQAVADEWNLKAQQWEQLGATIAGIEDKARADIDAQTDWNLVAGVAQGYIDTLDAI